MNKSAIRKEMSDKRSQLAKEEKVLLDQKICEAIEQVIDDKNYQVIHSYIPMGDEVDVRGLLNNLLADGKTVVCPKSLPKKEMQNLVLASLDQLEDGRFGTKHPASGIEYNGEIELYIVPGLAFDKRGYRIGYGSGYYDKFFSSCPKGYKVGVCYNMQLIDKVPEEPHDISLDEIISF
ncbi:MAG: 5-formyltetrahydrofolate cyclo-ligase [Flavipsychrobacter sp.]